MIKLAVKTVFHCRCVRCGHEWEAERKPSRCASCKYLSWNGEDKRFKNKYVATPPGSQIETGKSAPQFRPQAILQTLNDARQIVAKLIEDLGPCNHQNNECVCQETKTLAALDRQIASLQVFGGKVKDAVVP